MKESFSFPGEVTKYPVEEGADITDHIRDMPEQITLECIVSDSPIGDIANDPTRQIAAGPDGNTPLPSADALAKLRDLKAARKPFPVETSLGVFAMMAFLDLQVDVDAAKSPGNADPDPNKARAGGLFFTAKFERVRIVSNKRTKVRVKTNMANGGKSKAVAGTDVKITRTITWRHGNPPGAPWVFGNPIETVTATSSGNRFGMTRDEVREFLRAHPSSQAITYTDEFGVEIVGQRRDALAADLLRNEIGAATAFTRTPTAGADPAPLPDGLNKDRIANITAPPDPGALVRNFFGAH